MCIMPIRFPTPIATAALAAAAIACAVGPAQDPFGAPMPKAGAPKAGDPADPFGGGAAGAAAPVDKPVPAGGAAAAIADANKPPPPLAIQILRGSNPTSPEQLLR